MKQGYFGDQGSAGWGTQEGMSWDLLSLCTISPGALVVTDLLDWLYWKLL